MKINESEWRILKTKNKEMSEFVHTLRHDIRNYVAAIEGYAYLLKDEFDQNYLDRINKNIKNVNELIDRSLELADSGLMVEIESEVNLEEILSQCKDIIPKDVKLKNENLIKVKGDHVKIMQIFKKILKNAIIHGKPKHVHIKGIKTDTEYKLQFINDGDPIPEKKAKKIFDRPQSLKKNHGVGILIAKKLIEAHGWSISLNTEIENKTCFEISIPIESLVSN